MGFGVLVGCFFFEFICLLFAVFLIWLRMMRLFRCFVICVLVVGLRCVFGIAD